MKKSVMVGLMALMISACGSEPKDTEAVTDGAEQSQRLQAETAQTFGITPDEYSKELNAKLTGTALASEPLDTTELYEDDVTDVFIKDYTNKINLVGGVNKNGELESLEYILPISDDMTEVLESLVLLTSKSASILDPTVSEKTALETLKNMLDKITSAYFDTKDHQREVINLGNSTYLSTISEMGLRFTIEPAEDK